MVPLTICLVAEIPLLILPLRLVALPAVSMISGHCVAIVHLALILRLVTLLTVSMISDQFIALRVMFCTVSMLELMALGHVRALPLLRRSMPSLMRSFAPTEIRTWGVGAGSCGARFMNILR